MKKTTIRITGMTCQHCVKTVEREIGELDGIKSAKVDLSKNQGAFEFDEKKIDEKKIKDAIKDIGYKVE